MSAESENGANVGGGLTRRISPVKTPEEDCRCLGCQGGNPIDFVRPEKSPQYRTENRPEVPFMKGTCVIFQFWTFQASFQAFFYCNSVLNSIGQEMAKKRPQKWPENHPEPIKMPPGGGNSINSSQFWVWFPGHFWVQFLVNFLSYSIRNRTTEVKWP